MMETTRPELVAYQKERLAKFVSENQKLDKGQIVFAGDSISEIFALKKYLGREFTLDEVIPFKMSSIVFRILS